MCRASCMRDRGGTNFYGGGLNIIAIFGPGGPFITADQILRDITTMPEASTVSRELICCGCKKGCTGRCKCKKAALKCTALCQCGGEHCDMGHDN